MTGNDKSIRVSPSDANLVGAVMIFEQPKYSMTSRKRWHEEPDDNKLILK